MAAYQKRVDGTGRERFRAIVRKKVNGETVCKTKTFDTEVEAQNWAAVLESNIEAISDAGEYTLRDILIPRVVYSPTHIGEAYRSISESNLGSKVPETVTFESISTYILLRSASGADEDTIELEVGLVRKLLEEISDTKTEKTRLGYVDQALVLAKDVGLLLNSRRPMSAP